MKIKLEDIKTISIAEDEYLFINIKDDDATGGSLNALTRHLRNKLGHDRFIITNCDDLELTKIKYLDVLRENRVWVGNDK